jgi:hypothetical protein
MGAQGTTTLNFDAFPGRSDTSVAVTGQAGILAGSLVEAWLVPTATADHTADEHLLETIQVQAGNVVAGTGFTIYAVNTSQLNEGGINPAPIGKGSAAGRGTRIYGQWTVGWVWN